MRNLDLSGQSENTKAAIGRMMELYGDDMYKWIAELYDAETGGFYYSLSARDNDGFLPDVESTAQILNGMSNLGLFEEYDGNIRSALDEKMRENIIRFVRSLQDEDGFFYHKQWGKDIPVMRRGRDLDWSISLLNALGAEPIYPTAGTRIKSGKDVPEHLTSPDAFLAYARSHKQYIAGNMHHFVHVMNAQQTEICAAGLLPTLFDFLESEQRAETGLWGEGVNYNSVTALMKASLIYKYGKRRLCYPERALQSCIDVILSDETATRIVDITNPWVALINLISALKESGDIALADGFLEKIRDKSAQMIDKTTEKLKIYSQPYKTFSFLPEYTNPVSQNVPVALENEREGDVNATVICYNGAKRILTLIGVESPNFFDRNDYAEFLKLVNKNKG